MKHIQQKLTTFAALVLCLSLLAFGSLAYFTDEDTAHNVITTGGVNIDLLEWADDEKTEPFPEEGINGVMPGTTVTKIAEVKNTGEQDAYVRVKVDTNITLANGNAGDTTPVTLDFNETDWTYKDGFYYYKRALAPNDTTEPLFTHVAFDTDMDNSYQDSTAKVDVFAYATQVANNTNDPLTAAGWPEV